MFFKSEVRPEPEPVISKPVEPETNSFSLGSNI